MPRRARMYISGLPYHVVQRGNNRKACFFDSENYQYYLELWRDMLRRYEVQLHAYVLMTNHVHFLMTPLVEDGVVALPRQVLVLPLQHPTRCQTHTQFRSTDDRDHVFTSSTLLFRGKGCSASQVGLSSDQGICLGGRKKFK
jgi:hypothetical protein